VQALVKGYLLPTKLNALHNSLSPIHRDRLLRNTAHQSILFGVRDVNDILILICGHGGRDRRCGIMGPLLQEEFRKTLPARGIEVLQGPVKIDEYLENAKALEGQNLPNPAARVGLISHIGGHKYAGNVIIYIPPSARSTTGEPHALAGCGIWYGRVEPKHVEGIVSHTILRGAVFKDMFRGGVKQGGEILKL
jgi:Sucrase/ferredoxin-like